MFNVQCSPFPSFSISVFQPFSFSPPPPVQGSRFDGSRFEVRRFKVRGSTVQGSTVRGSRFKVQRFKVQGSTVQRFKVQRFNGSRFKVQRFKVQRFNGSGVHSAPVTLGDSPAGDPMLVVNPIALQIAGSAQGVQLSWPAGERGYLFNPILFP